MDLGQIVFIMCQLAFGAVAAFLAIMLWSKTRDAAWMLVIIGAIVAYIEIVYFVLEKFGMSINFLMIGSVSIITFILPLLRMVFFIAAFLIMIIRQSKTK